MGAKPLNPEQAITSKDFSIGRNVMEFSGLELTIATAGAAIASAVFAILQYSKTARLSEARIISPPHLGENRGRFLSVSGTITAKELGATYWVAIQPSGCRDQGVWWPQNHPLKLGHRGSWTVNSARIGGDGEMDVGSTFTVAVIKIPRSKRREVASYAKDDHRMTLPPGCRLLTAIEVRRVRE